jgi:ABC-2 type transport system ATP-binding protein
MDAVLRVQNLVVRYGALEVLHGFNFDVHAGEVFGLLGGNGAGKTTTLRALVGQKTPAGGSIEILGKDIATHWRDIKAQIGYVPDGANHFDELTGLQNLRFFAGLHGVHSSRVEESLGLVDLHAARDVRVADYSLGMRRKLLVARALLHQPRLLILDEPTANLDTHAAQQVRTLIRDHARQGGTVLLTTHQLDNIDELCDRVGILVAGQLQAIGAPHEIRQRHAGNKVAVQLKDGSRRIYDLDQPGDREALAELLAGSDVVAVQSCPFDFVESFSRHASSQF